MSAYNYGGEPLQANTEVSVPTVLCCNCGAPMDAATSGGLAMCYDCLRLSSDITEGISRENSVNFCRNCERYLQPPNHWIQCQPESRELLALCLRRLKGLSKVRLIDARFIWTEPHSRRIKVKITVQGEVFNSTIIQQSFEVEYVVIACQCPDCAKSFTANTWRATVQIRQKVTHKRTFLFLEQLILKHQAHKDTISIREAKDGLDFFYSQRNHAVKMIDFLGAVSPIRSKRSEELISSDTHTGTKSYKFTFSVELVPICKDDLVILPKKLANSLGNISRLTLCFRIGPTVHLIDPNTLQTADLSPSIYWRSPFSGLADSSSLVEFIVLDIEPTGEVNGKFVLADAVVARSSDMGRNDQTFSVRTHLGGILNPGDTAQGYFLSNANFNHDLWDSLDKSNIEDVVLVKKSYPNRKKNKKRNWKLRRMAKEYNVDDMGTKQRRMEADRVEREYEAFLQELEEDSELRTSINLYKKANSQTSVPKERQIQMEGVEDASGIPVKQQPSTNDDEDEDVEDIETDLDEGAPEIPIDELLDELEDMTLEEY